jgi:ABC-type multidrug transport system ATPase subunit
LAAHVHSRFAEPTSGLDATAAMDVCTLLKDIANETGA